MIHKACPIALHPDGAPLRIAVFTHQKTGAQLVKGTIQPGDPPAKAAARALFKQSGLETKSAIPIGDSTDIAPNQHWHFALCRVAPPVHDAWQHHCTEEGGHLFKFHWHDVDASAKGFAPQCQNALAWIAAHLR